MKKRNRVGSSKRERTQEKIGRWVRKTMERGVTAYCTDRIVDLPQVQGRRERVLGPLQGRGI